MSLPGVSVVVAHWGSSPARLRAIREASDSWALQDLDAEWVLAEACGPGVDTNLPWLLGAPWRRVRLELGADCAGLWQKEALYNAGIMASGSPLVVLLDSDVYSEDPTWLRRLCSAAWEAEGLGVQGFTTVEDSLDRGRIMHVSMVSTLESDCDSGNPGMAWAFRRSDLEANGLLNDLCVYGSGDSMMASEYFGDEQPELSDWSMTFGRFRELRRDVPRKLRAACLPDAIVHANHGGGRTHYLHRHRLAELFPSPIATLVRRSRNGLIEWAAATGLEREAVTAQASVGGEAALESFRDAFRLASLGAAVSAEMSSRPPVERQDSASPSQEERVNVLLTSAALDPAKPGLFCRESVALEALVAAGAPEAFDGFAFVVNDAGAASGHLSAFPSPVIAESSCRFPTMGEACSAALRAVSGRGEPWVFYVNSDCAATDLSWLGGPPAIMHRLDVACDPPTLSGVMRGPGTPLLEGIDGFYAPLSFLSGFCASGDGAFHLGRPCWDVAFGVRCLNGLPGCVRLRDVLRHPAHEKAWTTAEDDLSTVDAATRVNYALYHGELERLSKDPARRVEVLTAPAELPDTRPPLRVTTVIPTYSLCAGRPGWLSVLEESLSVLMRQGDARHSRVVVAEGVLADSEPAVPAILRRVDRFGVCEHVLLRASLDDPAPYRFIYQKEALLNAASRSVTGGVLHLMDGDVVCRDPNWLRAISEAHASAASPLVTCPWSTVAFRGPPGSDPLAVRCSFAASVAGSSVDDCNYGLSVSLDASAFLGINEMYVLGGGDSAFINRYAPSVRPTIGNYRHYDGLCAEDVAARPSGPTTLRALPFGIEHLHHGPVVSYGGKFSVLEEFGRPIRELVEREPGGLLRWRDVGCFEYRLLCAVEAEFPSWSLRPDDTRRIADGLR